VAKRKTATGCGCGCGCGSGRKEPAGGWALTIARRMKNTNHFKLLMLLLRLWRWWKARARVFLLLFLYKQAQPYTHTHSQDTNGYTKWNKGQKQQQQRRLGEGLEAFGGIKKWKTLAAGVDERQGFAARTRGEDLDFHTNWHNGAASLRSLWRQPFTILIIQYICTSIMPV